MRRRLHGFVPAAFLVAAVVVVPGAPAQAATTGGLTLTLIGGMSPGLTTTPTPQTMAMSGSLTGRVVMTTGPTTAPAITTTYTFLTVSCSFTGASGPTPLWPGDDVLRGAGGLGGPCGGTAEVAVNGEPTGQLVPISLSCGFAYVRDPTIVHLLGGCSIVFSSGSFQNLLAKGTMALTLTPDPLQPTPLRWFATAGNLTVS